MIPKHLARAAAVRRLTWRRLGYCAAFVALAALAATGCSSTSRSPSGQPPSQPRSLPQTAKLSACTIAGQYARCGYVWVPQDWAHPNGAKMQLRVVVLPAMAASHPAAPLFYLAGTGGLAVGDGDAVLNGLSWAAATFWQLNQASDLVFVEQRGTPGSGFQTCPGLQTQDPAAVRAAVSRCLAAVMRDPRHDSTTSAVRDLDQVRKDLGYNKINLYGVSYGVTLGLAYLQRYSAHVRAAIFDSGSLLNVRLDQQGPASAQQAFNQLARRCAATPACASAYHPAADLSAVLAHLRAHPVQVLLPGPSGPETVTVTAPAFLTLVESYYLGWASTAVLLPADLHALAHGQWTAVVRKRGFTTALRSTGTTSLQAVTIDCGDTWAAMDPVQVSRQTNSVFTPEFIGEAEWLHALCANWPHDPGVSGIVHSTVPVVFLNGTLDPADPPANVAAATRTMPNALLVSVPGSAHWTLNSTLNPAGCLPADAIAFIESGRPANPAVWTACTRALAHDLTPFPAP